MTGVIFLMLQLATLSMVSCRGASAGLKMAPHYMKYCPDVSKDWQNWTGSCELFFPSTLLLKHIYYQTLLLNNYLLETQANEKALLQIHSSLCHTVFAVLLSKEWRKFNEGNLDILHTKVETCKKSLWIIAHCISQGQKTISYSKNTKSNDANKHVKKNIHWDSQPCFRSKSTSCYPSGFPLAHVQSRKWPQGRLPSSVWRERARNMGK